MRKRNRLWSFALAGALAVSNLSGVVALPATSIVAMAADAKAVTWEGISKKPYYNGDKITPTIIFDNLLPASVDYSYSAVIAVNKGGKTVILDDKTSYDEAIKEDPAVIWTLTKDQFDNLKYSAGEKTLSAEDSDTFYDFEVYIIKKDSDNNFVSATRMTNSAHVDVYASRVAEIEEKITPAFGNIASTDDKGIEFETVATLRAERTNAEEKVLSYGVYPKTYFEDDANSNEDYVSLRDNFIAKRKTYNETVTAYQNALKDGDASKISAAEAAMNTAKTNMNTADKLLKSSLNTNNQIGDEHGFTVARKSATPGTTWKETATITTKDVLKKLDSDGKTLSADYVLFVSEDYTVPTEMKTDPADVTINTTYDFKVEADADFAIGRIKTPNPPTFEDDGEGTETKPYKAIPLGSELQLGAILTKTEGTSIDKSIITTDEAVTWTVQTGSEDFIGVSDGLVTTKKATSNKVAVDVTYTNGNVKTVKSYYINGVAAPIVKYTTPDGKISDTYFEVVVGEPTKLTAYVGTDEKMEPQSEGISWKAYKTETGTDDPTGATLGTDGTFTANEAGEYWVEATYTYGDEKISSDRKKIVAEATADQNFMIGTLTEDKKGVAVTVSSGVATAKPLDSLKVGKSVDLYAQIGTAEYNADGSVKAGTDNRKAATADNVTWTVADGYSKYVDVKNGKVTAIGANASGAKIIATYRLTDTETNVATITKSEFVISKIEGYTVDVHTSADKTATNVEIASDTTANLVMYVDGKEYEKPSESEDVVEWKVYKASSGDVIATGAEINNGVFDPTSVGTYYVVATYKVKVGEGNDQKPVYAEFSNNEARFVVNVVENADKDFIVGTKAEGGNFVDVNVKLEDTVYVPSAKPLTSLSVDETVQLYAQVGSATYKENGSVVSSTDNRKIITSGVTWKVADAYKDYIEVDSNGLVTAKASTYDSDNETYGKVYVTATYKVDGKSTDATFEITKILANVVKVETSDGKDTANVAIGETQKFVAYVDKDSRSEGIKWEVYQASEGSTLATSDKAEIDTNGNFTAYAEGTYYVQATYTKHNIPNSPRFAVIVEPARFAIGFKSGIAENKSLYVGDSVNLKATYGKYDITSDANVVWSVSDPNYATVSKGVVTVIKGDEDGRAFDVTATYTVGNNKFESNAITFTASADEPNIRDEVGTDTSAYASIIEGKTLQLVLYNGSKKDTETKVSWIVKDDKVASVSSKGLVTANKVGFTTVTAVDASTNKWLAEYTVVVVKANIDVRDKNKRLTFSTDYENSGTGYDTYDATITLTSPTSLAVGETVTLEGLFGGAVVSGKWTSGNNNVATVNSTSGVVNIKKAVIDHIDNLGTEQTPNYVYYYVPAKIVFEYENHKALVEIDINANNGIIISDEQNYDNGNYDELTYIKVAVDGSDQLVVLNGTTDVTSKYNFKSDNEAVATVDSNGKVVGKKQGEATITATAKDDSGKKDTIKVNVFEKLEVEKVQVNSENLSNRSLILEIGKNEKLIATVTPTGTTETLTWTSSNTSVATVANGVVTAVAEGKATITAKAGDVFTEITVTVVKSEEEVKKEREQAEKAMQDAIAAANTAAEAAVADPTDANIKELEDAITAAKNAGASDEDVKAAENQLNDALKGAKNNAEIAKEASDKKAADAETAKATAEQKAAADVKAANDKAAAAEQKATTAEKKSEELQKKADAEFETLKKAKATNGYIVNTFKNGEATLVSIPAAKTKATMTLASKVTVNGKKYKVTRIANKALKNNKKIKTLTVPASYKVIGSYAFSSKVTKLTVKGSNVQVLNNALKSINKNAKVIAKNTYTRTQLKTFGKAKKTVTISKK